jgi:hypothetical protein
MEVGGLNLYGFCRNNGVNLWDFLGMTPGYDPTEGGITDSVFETGAGGTTFLVTYRSVKARYQPSELYDVFEWEEVSRRDTNPDPRTTVTGFDSGNGLFIDLTADNSVSGGTTLVPTIADSWKNISTPQELALYMAYGNVMSMSVAQEFFREMVLATIGALAGGAVEAAGTMVFRVGAEAGGTTTLYRAVMPGEAADIAASGVLRNPNGIEVKYFSTTIDGAASYAQQASRAFGDGPFTFIRVDVPTNLITTEMRVTVDRGVPTVVLPSNMLPHTSFPQPVTPPVFPSPIPVP